MSSEVPSEISLKNLSLEDLRRQWAEIWNISPHRRISRATMIQSIIFRQQEKLHLSLDQQAWLQDQVRQYKRNSHLFDSGMAGGIRPGTRLLRAWKGKKYSVLVKDAGYEYDGKMYGSLSEIARIITGTRWNGWLFFGLRKKSENVTERHEAC